MWSETKDLIMLTAVSTEGVYMRDQGSRECGCAWQIHRLLLCTLSVMKNVHGALLYTRQNNLPSIIELRNKHD